MSIERAQGALQDRNALQMCIIQYNCSATLRVVQYVGCNCSAIQIEVQCNNILHIVYDFILFDFIVETP